MRNGPNTFESHPTKEPTCDEIQIIHTSIYVAIIIVTRQNSGLGSDRGLLGDDLLDV